jgi:hypothetical protein
MEDVSYMQRDRIYDAQQNPWCCIPWVFQLTDLHLAFRKYSAKGILWQIRPWPSPWRTVPLQRLLDSQVVKKWP